jgi:hypothetical protein
MRNTTRAEDFIVGKCNEFGGIATECVEIVQRLDSTLTQMEKENGDLLDTIWDLEQKIKDMEESKEA